MVKSLKKFKSASLIVVVILMVTVMMISVSASVVGGYYSGYKQINHNNSYSFTSFSVRIKFPNGINNTRHIGTSTTKWMGSTPFFADQIVHRNIISVSALGGLSISSSGGGASVSGSQVTDEMSNLNSWQINSNFDYTIRAAIFIFSTDFATSGRVKIGSNYYSFSAAT